MAIKAVFYFDGDNVMIHQDEAKDVRKTFRPGRYSARYTPDGLKIKELKKKELFNPAYSSNSSTILKYLNKFKDPSIRKEVNNMGFVHKLGIFLYGTYGTGKTSLMNYVCDRMVEEENAIVLVVDGGDQVGATIDLASMIRDIQDNMVVVVLDEIDEYAEDLESSLKTFLDGQYSVNNSVFLAATNYYSRIPKTLLRPSRFKIVTEVKGIEDLRVIKDIVKPLNDASMKLDREEFDDFCEGLKGSTLDEIKSAVLDHVMDLRLAVNNRSIGFSRSSEDAEEDVDEYEKFKKMLQRYDEEDDYYVTEAYRERYKNRGHSVVS